MRLAMKPGVSLQRTTLLPSRWSANARDGCHARRAGCVGAGDDFQQAHVARRIEEMGDQEIARRSRSRWPSISVVSGMVEVLEETMEPGFRTVVELARRGPLDVEAARRRPRRSSRSRRAARSSSMLPGVTSLALRLVHEGRRIGLQHLLDGACGDRAAVVAARPSARCRAAAPARRHWRPGRRCRRPSRRRRSR